jgi:tetratricopeptide (TPR) repeat protein
LHRLVRTLLVPAALTAALSLGLSGCGSDKPKAKEATASQLVSAGLTAAGQGDDKAALSAFSQATVKDPSNYYAHYNLGTIYQKQNKTTLALQEYGLALQSNPQYVPALYNSATIYGATDPQLAITTYRKVIKLQPKAPTAYLNLGLLEAKLGIYGQAEKDLQKALDQDPKLVNQVPKDVFKKRPTPSASATPAK